MNDEILHPSARARLSMLCKIFGLDHIADRSSHNPLEEMLSAPHLTDTTKSTIAFLAVCGRYPTRWQRDLLTTLVNAGEPTRIRMHLAAACLETPRRIRRARCIAISGVIVDVTRTAESISLTGVSRVVRAIACRGRMGGATLVTWRAGCPVVFEQSMYANQEGARFDALDSMKQLTVKARVRLVGWRMYRVLGRVPGVVLAATYISDWLQRTALTYGFRRPTTVILGPGEYILAETPDAITCERISVWHECLPVLAITPFVHDMLPMSHPQYFPPNAVEDFAAFLNVALDAPAAITSTKAVASELEKHALARERGRIPIIDVIGFGSDAATWCPAVIAPVEVPMFLTVGGFDDRKNVADLLRALIELAQAGLSLGVRIVAQSVAMSRSTRSIITRARAAGIKVEIHCRISDSLMAAFIDQAPATVYLSSAEGYGLPIVESLVRGTPVIASDIPSTRELAGYGGVQLIPPGDLQALAFALQKVARDPDHRLRMIEAIDATAIPPGLDAWAAALLRRASG